MKMIDITTILGCDLKSRTSARDFAKYLQNMNICEAQVDFTRVKSVTRSFMDEFYYLMAKEGNAMGVKLEIVNMGEEAKAFLKAVKATADAPHKIAVSDNARFLNPSTVKQVSEYLATL